MATGRKGKIANKLKNVFGEFTKGIEVKAELDADHPMIDATLQPLTTDSVTLNRKSLKELDTVLDEMIELNPEWRVKLKKIIEDSK